MWVLWDFRLRRSRDDKKGTFQRADRFVINATIGRRLNFSRCFFMHWRIKYMARFYVIPGNSTNNVDIYCRTML